MTNKHTPLPWVVELNPTIPEGIQVAAFETTGEMAGNRHLQIIIRSHNPDADAELIVEAVNNYERLQAEYEQLISYTKNGIECFASPCTEHSGLNVPPFSEFQERYARLCLMCVVDERDALRAECDALRAKTSMSIGVGDGTGNLFVHGDEKLLKHLQNMIDQTTPLEPEPGNPMWSRRIQLDEVIAERDSLRAECEKLRRVVGEKETIQSKKLQLPIEEGE